MIVVIIFAWVYYENAWERADKMFARGCTATTASWTGIPTTFKCPVSEK